MCITKDWQTLIGLMKEGNNIMCMKMAALIILLLMIVNQAAGLSFSNNQ